MKLLLIALLLALTVSHVNAQTHREPPPIDPKTYPKVELREFNEWVRLRLWREIGTRREAITAMKRTQFPAELTAVIAEVMRYAVNGCELRVQRYNEFIKRDQPMLGPNADPDECITGFVEG